MFKFEIWFKGENIHSKFSECFGLGCMNYVAINAHEALQKFAIDNMNSNYTVISVINDGREPQAARPIE